MQHKQKKIIEEAPGKNSKQPLSDSLLKRERELYLQWAKQQRKNPNSLSSWGEKTAEELNKAFGDTDEE